MMKAVRTSETSVDNHFTRQYIPEDNSENVFTLQKKVIRIIAGVKPRNSCRNLFKGLEILPLPCEYIFLLMNFIVNNQELFQTNSAAHSVNTRNKHQLTYS
jgi:hypothetical protein